MRLEEPSKRPTQQANNGNPQPPWKPAPQPGNVQHHHGPKFQHASTMEKTQLRCITPKRIFSRTAKARWLDHPTKRGSMRRCGQTGIGAQQVEVHPFDTCSCGKRKEPHPWFLPLCLLVFTWESSFQSFFGGARPATLGKLATSCEKSPFLLRANHPASKLRQFHRKLPSGPLKRGNPKFSR